MSTTNTETAVSYAALILADSDTSIIADKLQTLLSAAGIEDVEPIWTTLFAKALEGKNVKEIITTVAVSALGTKGVEVESGDQDYEDICEGSELDGGEEVWQSDDEAFCSLFD